MAHEEKPDGRLGIRAPKRVVRQIDEYRIESFKRGGSMLSRSSAALYLLEDGLAAYEAARGMQPA